MRLPHQWEDNINTNDTVANQIFGMDKFDIKFNHNLRWFWKNATESIGFNYKKGYLNIKNMDKAPLEQQKIIDAIFLN